LWRIGLTGWEIFSKVDAAKWNLNQAEDISPRVFRLLQGPSIPESNQRGKRNKNHMNPLIQLKNATPPFVIALVLACFALSPQAFAVEPPKFDPPSGWLTNVRIYTTTNGARIKVGGFGPASITIANNSTITLCGLGSVTIWAKAIVSKSGVWISSGKAFGTYTYQCGN
jgi:hypothetical protein